MTDKAPAAEAAAANGTTAKQQQDVSLEGDDMFEEFASQGVCRKIIIAQCFTVDSCAAPGCRCKPS